MLCFPPSLQQLTIEQAGPHFTGDNSLGPAEPAPHSATPQKGFPELPGENSEPPSVPAPHTDHVTIHPHRPLDGQPQAQSSLLTAACRARSVAAAEWRPGMSGLLGSAGAGAPGTPPPSSRSQLPQEGLCWSQEGAQPGKLSLQKPAELPRGRSWAVLPSCRF